MLSCGPVHPDIRVYVLQLEIRCSDPDQDVDSVPLCPPVVHEMNGEDGVMLLSFSEVEELIHKADEASMMSQTVATVTSLPTAEVQEEAGPTQEPPTAAEITGLEAKVGAEPSVAEASAENPITMVFMGYQNVEDEDETKRVLGLQGTVKAELVLIDDGDGKTSPGEGKEEPRDSQTVTLPPPASTALPPSPKPSPSPPPTPAAATNGDTTAEKEKQKSGAVQIKKEKQPCKCCSIM